MKNWLLPILAVIFSAFGPQTCQSQCSPDVILPTVACFNGLSVGLPPTASIVIYDTDFLQYATDNCTPSPDIETSIVRASDNYTSFPLNSSGLPIHGVEVSCADLGTLPVQLWARDAAGNADFCQSYLTINDNLGGCVAKITLGGFAKTETGSGIQNATVSLIGPGMNSTAFTDETGQFSFSNVPTGQSYQVCVSKDDNPLNGLSTFDPLLISKHIQQIQPLGSPYKIIGCDVTASNAPPSVGDLLHIRNLILGIYDDFPKVPSWRFIDSSVVLDATNPFLTPGMPGLLNGCRTVVVGSSNVSVIDFVGMKSGDANGNAISNN